MSELSTVQETFLDLYEEGADITAAAKAVSRTRQAVWYWRKTNEAFKSAWDLAVQRRQLKMRIESISDADEVRKKLRWYALNAKSDMAGIKACCEYLDRIGYSKISASAKVVGGDLLGLLGLQPIEAVVGDDQLNEEEVVETLSSVPPHILKAALERQGVEG